MIDPMYEINANHVRVMYIEMHVLLSPFKEGILGV